MTNPSPPTTLEIGVQPLDQLQSLFRDLTALLALPAAWGQAEPKRIVEDLLDVLVTMLNVYVAYAHVPTPEPPNRIEAARVAGRPLLAGDLDGLGRSLLAWLEAGQFESRWMLPGSHLGAPLRLVQLALGMEAARGWVVIGAGHEEFPTELEHFVFRMAVNQANNALQAGRHRAELARTAERSQRLQMVTAALAETLTRDQVAATVIEQAIPALGASGGTAAVLTPDGAAFEVIAHAGLPEERLKPWQRFPADALVPMADAVRQGELVLLPTRESFKARYPILGSITSYIQAGAIIPFLLGDRAVGALSLSFDASREFSPNDREFMLALGRQCALALERTRLYDAERSLRESEQQTRRTAEQSAERIARLQAVTAALAAALTRDEVAEAIFREGILAVKADASAILLLNEAEQCLEVRYTAGFPTGSVLPCSPLDAPYPATEVVRTQAPIWVSSYEEFATRYPGSAPIRAITGHQAVAYLPLMVSSRALGVMTFSYAQVHPFDPQQQEFLRTLASQCAQALERARLYENELAARAAADAAARQANLLAEASRLLSSALNGPMLLHELASLLVPAYADWYIVHLVAPDGAIQQAILYNADPDRIRIAEEIHRQYPLPADAPYGYPRVLRTGEPDLLADIPLELTLAAARNAEHLALMRQVAFRSNLCVPLTAHGQQFGALTLAMAESDRRFQAADLGWAQELASRMALALDNSQLYAQLEQRVAERTAELSAAVTALQREVGKREQVQLRLSGLVESAPDAIVIVDSNGHIVLANAQTERLFGYSAAQLVGQPVEQLMPNRYRQQHHQHRAAFALDPRVRPMGAGLELFGQRRDGHEFPIEISLSPLQTPDGPLVISAIRDVTERKRTEDQLRASREELRQLHVYLQAAREEERRHIAYELHDDLGGALTRLKLEAAQLQRADRGTDPKLAAHLAAIDQTIQLVRRIAMEIRPAILDDLGLVAAIQWQLEEFQKRSGIQCQLRTEVDDIPLDADTATALFRVCQESLTNIGRHARATEVTVTLQVQPDYLVLWVQDNGQGFNPTEVKQKHTLGLVGMRERIFAVAGQFDVQSQLGRGTAVLAQVPMARAQE